MRAAAIRSLMLVSILLTGCVQQVSTQNRVASVMLREHQVFVEEARTSDEQTRGLAGVYELDWDHGMLFVFPTQEQRTFWMKGMLIPIDIIWLQGNVIVGIEHSVPIPDSEASDSELPLYPSPAPADFVLEVAAGLAERVDLAEGDTVTFRYER